MIYIQYLQLIHMEMKAPKCNIKKRTKATHSKFRLCLGVLVIFFPNRQFSPPPPIFFSRKNLTLVQIRPVGIRSNKNVTPKNAAGK